MAPLCPYTTLFRSGWFVVRIVAVCLREDRRVLGGGAAVVLDADARDAASDRPDAALVQAARGRLADDDHRPLVAGLHACVDRVDGGALRLHQFGAADRVRRVRRPQAARSEEHTSELQSLMRISYAVFCLKKKKII